jgi:hypothetical protein
MASSTLAISCRSVSRSFGVRFGPTGSAAATDVALASTRAPPSAIDRLVTSNISHPPACRMEWGRNTALTQVKEIIPSGK